MSQTEAIIFLSRFQSYKVALLKLCEKRSRIFVGIASSIFCCENLGRKLQLNGRNRDLCILLLLYNRNSGTSDGTEENYPKNHFIAENNNGCFDERDQREITITGFN